MVNTGKPKSTRSKSEFWDDQAKVHGASDLATAPDHYYRELEIESILRVLVAMKPETILDVGCGNGYTTLKIGKQFPAATVVGVDSSKEMIAEARKHSIPN